MVVDIFWPVVSGGSGWRWVVVGSGGSLLADGEWWWVVVDIFWLVVDGGVWWCVVVGRGEWWHSLI